MHGISRAIACLALLLAACSPKKDVLIVSTGASIAISADVPEGKDNDAAVISSAVVIQVLCDSPAHKAGVLKGDVVIKMNGSVLRGMTLAEYSEILAERKPGVKIKLLLFRRGKGTFGADLVVEPLTNGKLCDDPPSQRI